MLGRTTKNNKFDDRATILPAIGSDGRTKSCSREHPLHVCVPYRDYVYAQEKFCVEIHSCMHFAALGLWQRHTQYTQSTVHGNALLPHGTGSCREPAPNILFPVPMTGPFPTYLLHYHIAFAYEMSRPTCGRPTMSLANLSTTIPLWKNGWTMKPIHTTHAKHCILSSRISLL